MIKELIDLQRNANATCVVIENVDSEKLSPIVIMKANVSDKFLLTGSIPPFADKIDEQCKKNKLYNYLIIKRVKVNTNAKTL